MFNNIVGNEEIKETLENAIKSNKISHSYMFLGTEGIGKRQVAIEFAKNIFGTENDINNNPDFKIIEPDGNSLKIEQIREMQSKIIEKPIMSNKKVYIINDSDKMTTEAQNCLLKTLEEPPEYVVLILIGKNENSFLETIKSRCMVLNFNKIKDEQILKFLKENYDTDIKSKTIINAFQGSIGKAIKIKDKQKEYEEIEDIISNVENRDKIDVLNIGDIIIKEKDDKFEILEYINTILLSLAKKRNKYAECINIVEDTKKRLKSNANYDMSIDNMLLKIWEQVN